MHIVYSAWRGQQSKSKKGKLTVNAETALRLKAHLQVCEKYKNEIAAIKKQIPDWHPSFSANQ